MENFIKEHFVPDRYWKLEAALLFFGDVNPGATVVSKGNVVVLGTLKGTIHAGAAGNEGAFVAALNMNPMQIQIADAIARAADDKPEKKSRKAKETSTGPMIAYTEDGNIYMEPITKRSYQRYPDLRRPRCGSSDIKSGGRDVSGVIVDCIRKRRCG